MVNQLSERYLHIVIPKIRHLHRAEPPVSSRHPEGTSYQSRASEDNEDYADDRLPSFSHPVVTYTILALIGVIFLAMSVLGHGKVSNVALAFGAKDNELIRNGQYWRFVTPIFLHGGWLHLLVNGFSLYQLGGSMERIYGARKYLIIFIAAGIAGNVLSFALSPTPSLGASGALFGLVGAGIVFPLRFKDMIQPEARRSILGQLTRVALFNLVIGFTLRAYVDNWAHIGGLLGGAFAALFLIPAVLEPEPRSPQVNFILTFFTSVMVGIVLLSGLLQGNWAMQNIAPSMLLISPVGTDPWWTVNIPTSWKLRDGAWRSPEGAVLTISDSLNDPQAAREALAIALHKDKPNTALDGKVGWYLETNTPQGAIQEYRIHAYDRLMVLKIQYPSNVKSPKIQRDFQLIVASLRFIHPPPQNVSNPSP